MKKKVSTTTRCQNAWIQAMYCEPETDNHRAILRERREQVAKIWVARPSPLTTPELAKLHRAFDARQARLTKNEEIRKTLAKDDAAIVRHMGELFRD